MSLHIRRQSKAAAEKRLLVTLQALLADNKQVLWLVSGGSNIEIECDIASRLKNTSKLQAALIDERYGEPGHNDSNYKQLLEAGFEKSGVILTPVLEPDLSIADTTARYADKLETMLDTADVVIAQLGIGADGHTAGVLPRSPIVSSKKLVDHYQGPDYERISMTFEALRFADTVFVFAYGADKVPVLRQLATEDISLAEQPSQIFKQLPEVYLYNDAIDGETA